MGCWEDTTRDEGGREWIVGFVIDRSRADGSARVEVSVIDGRRWVNGQSRIMLVVGDRRIWIRIVEDSRCSRIEWWRCGLCIDRSAFWQLHGDRDWRCSTLSARAHGGVLAQRCAAGSHADDTRAWFAISGLICRSLVRALQ